MARSWSADRDARRGILIPYIGGTLGDWLKEFERVQLMLRLSPRLRESIRIRRDDEDQDSQCW